MDVVNCPASNCKSDGPFRRVLAHFRSSHDPDECSANFVRENNLVQCPTCHQWFIRLNQYTSKCAHLSRRHLHLQRLMKPLPHKSIRTSTVVSELRSPLFVSQTIEVNGNESNAQQEA